jgi:hypothetical protein
MVGTSAIASARTSDEITIARTLPERTCGLASTTFVTAIGRCPPATAVTCVPPPG